MLIFTALNFVIILFLKLRKNSVLLSKKEERGRAKWKLEKNRKWVTGLRFKFAFISGRRTCLFPEHPGLSYTFLTFFSHFVCAYNICTICRRRILVEISSTLFQGCFTTKTGEVCEPYWDIRGTKNSVSWKRGWMISQLSARNCGVFNVPSWCINWTPRSSVMNLYSSHIWWVWPA